MSVLDDIRRDEGFRAVAYPDPLTGGAPWTVGYGFTGPNIGQHTVMSLGDAEAELAKRVAKITTILEGLLPGFLGLAEPRQAVLVNMAYQQGVTGLLGFHRALAAMQAGRWGDATGEFIASRWAIQTPARAVRRCAQFFTGERP